MASSRAIYNLDNCRLRHGLNNDCLLQIFEYLQVKDLVQLCKMDDYYLQLITTQFISRKVIDLGVLDKRMPNNRVVLRRSAIESFSMFGKFIKKFVIRGEDFKQLLETIVKYCEPNKFTDVTFELETNGAFPEATLINKTMPFFSMIRKLRLFDDSMSGVFEDFLAHISSNSTKLEVLQLRQVDVDNGWLPNMQNLKQLQIHDTPMLLSLEDLKSCFRVNPNLKSFGYEGRLDISNVFNTLSECCSRLETFSDCLTDNPYSEFDTEMKNRYKCLSTLTQLKEVTLTSFTEGGHDLYSHLQMPAMGNISKLKVFMACVWPILMSADMCTEIMQYSSIPFNNLKTVDIEIRSIEDAHCDVRCEFILNFVAKLKTVENIKLTGNAIVNLSKVLVHAPNIRRLYISEVYSQQEHISNEMRNIVRVLRRIPIRHPSEGKRKNHLLEIKVNRRQWVELEIYEGLSRVMATSVG